MRPGFSDRSSHSDPSGKGRLAHPAYPTYYILFRGDEVEDIRLAADMALGVTTNGALTDAHNAGVSSFYQVQQPLDTDGAFLGFADLPHSPCSMF